MKRLKLYIHTKRDLDQMIKVYSKVLNAKIYKQNKYTKQIIEKNKLPKNFIGKTLYANLKLFNGDIQIMFSRWSERFNQPYGTNLSIIIFFDDDKKEFNKIYKNMKKSKFFHMQYDKDTYNTWGTQITKFHDDFDLAWVLELDVRKVDNNWNPVKGKIKNHKAIDD